jgi:hypothetical protein
LYRLPQQEAIVADMSGKAVSKISICDGARDQGTRGAKRLIKVKDALVVCPRRAMTRFGSSSAAKFVVLSCLATQLGVPADGGYTSAQHNEATAPRVYHFRDLNPTIFGIGDKTRSDSYFRFGMRAAVIEIYRHHRH